MEGNNKQLIAKALERVEDSSFECNIVPEPDMRITCGSDTTDIELTSKQLNYLISKEVDSQLLPADLEKEEVDIEKLINDAAYAFYMEDDEELYKDSQCRGISQQLENYLYGWKELFEWINSGKITEAELPMWLEYFDEKENLLYSSISEWVSFYGEIGK